MSNKSIVSVTRLIYLDFLDDTGTCVCNNNVFDQFQCLLTLRILDCICKKCQLV